MLSLVHLSVIPWIQLWRLKHYKAKSKSTQINSLMPLSTEFKTRNTVLFSIWFSTGLNATLILKPHFLNWLVNSKKFQLKQKIWSKKAANYLLMLIRRRNLNWSHWMLQYVDKYKRLVKRFFKMSIVTSNPWKKLWNFVPKTFKKEWPNAKPNAKKLKLWTFKIVTKLPTEK